MAWGLMALFRWAGLAPEELAFQDLDRSDLAAFGAIHSVLAMAIVDPSGRLVLRLCAKAQNHQVLIRGALEPVWCLARDHQSFELADLSGDDVIGRVEAGPPVEQQPDRIVSTMRMQVCLAAVGDYLDAARDQVSPGRAGHRLAVFEQLWVNLKYLKRGAGR